MSGGEVKLLCLTSLRGGTCSEPRLPAGGNTHLILRPLCHHESQNSQSGDPQHPPEGLSMKVSTSCRGWESRMSIRAEERILVSLRLLVQVQGLTLHLHLSLYHQSCKGKSPDMRNGDVWIKTVTRTINYRLLN